MTNNTVYFYNGFKKPVVVGHSTKDLKENVVLSDTYRGDVTDEFLESISELPDFKATSELLQEDITSINEILDEYDLYLNPTLDLLIDAFKSYFGSYNRHNASTCYDHLKEFGTKEEIDNIYQSTYDDFERYPDYIGRFIVVNANRYAFADNVIDDFATLECAEEYVNSRCDGDDEPDCFILGVNYAGRAYYPTF